MDELLNLGRPRPAGKVKGNIDKFESLTLSDSTNQPSSASTKSKRSILEISSTASDTTREPFDLQPSQDKSEASSQLSTVAPLPNAPPLTQPASRKKRESVAFLEKSYLDRKSDEMSDTLPDDAREILKSKPDYEDLLAVLQYLEYGVQGKHDFNIHVTDAKAAQVVNVLVTVTIPDHWPVLRIHKLPKQQQQLKDMIVLNLRSVAGIGALILQIRHRSIPNAGDHSILEDTVSVLQLVLHGTGFIRGMLNDSRKLFPKDTQRRIWWQELTTLVAGSRVLSHVAQAVTVAGISSNRLRWLSDGNEFCEWLANNISTAIVDLSIQDSEAWTMLAQMTKRSLNLGYRGMSSQALLSHC